jgi:hypothetical protein
MEAAWKREGLAIAKHHHFIAVYPETVVEQTGHQRGLSSPTMTDNQESVTIVFTTSGMYTNTTDYSIESLTVNFPKKFVSQARKIRYGDARLTVLNNQKFSVLAADFIEKTPRNREILPCILCDKIELSGNRLTV